jgi:hypothetical protein
VPSLLSVKDPRGLASCGGCSGLNDNIEASLSLVKGPPPEVRMCPLLPRKEVMRRVKKRTFVRRPAMSNKERKKNKIISRRKGTSRHPI